MNLLDNPIIHGIGKIADFIILNLLWLVCSLPIFTIGASTTALYAITLKLVKNEEGYIVKGFFKAFKENFKQSTLMWLIFMLLGVVLIIDFSSLKFMPGDIAAILQILLLVLGCLLISGAVYTFSLQARFENTIKNTLKNAVILIFARLPYTILIIIVSVAPIIVTFLTVQTLVIGLSLWFFIGVALVAYLHSFLLRHIFKILEEPQLKEQENDIL